MKRQRTAVLLSLNSLGTLLVKILGAKRGFFAFRRALHL